MTSGYWDQTFCRIRCLAILTRRSVAHRRRPTLRTSDFRSLLQEAHERILYTISASVCQGISSTMGQSYADVNCTNHSERLLFEQAANGRVPSKVRSWLNRRPSLTLSPRKWTSDWAALRWFPRRFIRVVEATLILTPKRNADIVCPNSHPSGSSAIPHQAGSRLFSFAITNCDFESLLFARHFPLDTIRTVVLLFNQQRVAASK